MTKITIFFKNNGLQVIKQINYVICDFLLLLQWKIILHKKNNVKHINDMLLLYRIICIKKIVMRNKDYNRHN